MAENKIDLREKASRMIAQHRAAAPANQRCEVTEVMSVTDVLNLVHQALQHTFDNQPKKKPSIDQIITLRGMLEEVCQSYFEDGLEQGRRETMVIVEQDLGAEVKPYKESTNLGVHLSHCNFGEYANSCKYGDVQCPALSPGWSWLGKQLQRAERVLESGGEALTAGALSLASGAKALSIMKAIKDAGEGDVTLNQKLTKDQAMQAVAFLSKKTPEESLAVAIVEKDKITPLFGFNIGHNTGALLYPSPHAKEPRTRIPPAHLEKIIDSANKKFNHGSSILPSNNPALDWKHWLIREVELFHGIK